MSLTACEKLGIANCNRLIKNKSELQLLIKEVKK
jgi:hypothetical protein